MILPRGQNQSRPRPPTPPPPPPRLVAEDAARVRSLVDRDPGDQNIDVCWVDIEYGRDPCQFQHELGEAINVPGLKVVNVRDLNKPIMRNLWKDVSRLGRLVGKYTISLPYDDASKAPNLFYALDKRHIGFVYCEIDRRPYQCDKDGDGLYYMPKYSDKPNKW